MAVERDFLRQLISELYFRGVKMLRCGSVECFEPLTAYYDPKRGEVWGTSQFIEGEAEKLRRYGNFGAFKPIVGSFLVYSTHTERPIIKSVIPKQSERAGYFSFTPDQFKFGGAENIVTVLWYSEREIQTYHIIVIDNATFSVLKTTPCGGRFVLNETRRGGSFPFKSFKKCTSVELVRIKQRIYLETKDKKVAYDYIARKLQE